MPRLRWLKPQPETIIKSATHAEWVRVNPTLKRGELGHVTDSGVLRVGDGATEFTSLSAQGAVPGTELAYAERASTYTNTVSGSNLGNASSIVTGLGFTVSGTGRPVDITVSLPYVQHTASTPIRIGIVVDGATIISFRDQHVVANTVNTINFTYRMDPWDIGTNKSIDLRMAGAAAGTLQITVVAGTEPTISATAR